ncbi:MAG: hypothetical protein ACRENU_14250 [Gemmatimonadaceae bacterium]
MTVRLGLGVGRCEVRAVLVRDGRAVWHGKRAHSGVEEVADAVVNLLVTAPSRRFSKTRVVAAFGPGIAQVKRISGLPAVSDGATAAQIVRGNTSRFFLRNGVPLASTSLHSSNGVWWGGVLEVPMLLAIESACRRLPLRLQGCVPALAALANLVRDGTVTAQDSGTAASLTLRSGTWLEVRREAPSETGADVAGKPARPGLADATYADAYAAACCTRRSPLWLAPTDDGRSTRRAIRTALAVLAAIALIAVVAAPGLSASQRLARNAPRLAALRDSVSKWAPVLQQLNATTASLAEIDRYFGDRKSVTKLLGALSDALPDSSAIVSLRIDSVSGSLTVLSASAASIVPELAAIQEVFDPRIFGAVTREMVGQAQLQRMAVRFDLVPRSPVLRRGAE